MALFDSIPDLKRDLILPMRSATAWFVAIIFGQMLMQIVFVAVVLGRGKQVDNLYRDLIAIGDLPLWSGLISQIGGMVMTGAAAIGLFAYFAASEAKRRGSRFLLMAGALSLVLALDDLLLLHDGWLLRLGVPEALTQATYALAAMAFVFVFRRQLLTMDRLAQACLIGGLVAMACSAVADVVLESGGNLYVEEGAKQVGFVFWLLFVARAAAAQRPLRETEARRPA